MRSMTELRQACCHPQIVRRQDALLGQQRLSMDQILVRLTTQAFNQYDNALRAYHLLQVTHLAVQAHFSKSLGENRQQLAAQICADTLVLCLSSANGAVSEWVHC